MILFFVGLGMVLVVVGVLSISAITIIVKDMWSDRDDGGRLFLAGMVTVLIGLSLMIIGWANSR